MENSINKAELSSYKFSELKVYSSTEWLSGNKKRYRQVFDAYETGYIYAELSFINKLFDERNWTVDVDLKCYEFNQEVKELCNLSFKKKISKHDHTIYVREGWGNKKAGVFWKKGIYYWEAYIDKELVGTKYFYIIDSQSIAEEKLLEYKSIKLYEGKYDDVNDDDRVYMSTFSHEESRYIYLEVVFKNLLTTDAWELELFSRFFNGTRELKGQVNRLRKIKKGEDTIVITAGWGSNVKGSWKPGHYSIELIFLGRLLATVEFEVAEDFVEGIPVVKLPETIHGIRLNPEEDLNHTFEDIMIKLDSLVGLQQIKKQVRDHAKYIQFLQLRKDNGFKELESINVHSVFTGNPGTGKTTVARLIGILYKKMGLLSKGHIHEVDRADLVGEYIGQTAPKVKENIQKARGGVLFIDEAYSLARANDDSKDFGREVIEILVKEMSNGPGDLAIIVAGYPKEMKHFIDSNPGLQSRFKHFYEFSDYLPQELSAISKIASENKEILLSQEAQDQVNEVIVEAFRKRDRNFGNARYVIDLMEKAKINMGLRLMNTDNVGDLTRDQLMNVEARDVQDIHEKDQVVLPDIPIDHKLLKKAMDELDAMIGIENVKKQINELISIVKFHKKNGQHVLNKYFLHTSFIGNPGTGKTTVARILTKIYKALGILERGHMVETDRQGLVAGFVGQTAIKTAERIDEAMGGVLFIDEAYALSNFNGLQGDYGNEAIQTILKRMEDNRGKFFVFAAGYPDNMRVFLNANPGLSSRFDKQLLFHDYSPEELLKIALKMISDLGYSIEKPATTLLKNHLITIYDRRDKHFGNARNVRNIILDIIKLQNLRLAEEDANDSSLKIKKQDVSKMILDNESEKGIEKPSIGFKR